MPPTKALREKREALVIEHMESENRHEYAATITPSSAWCSAISSLRWSGNAVRVSSK